MCTLAMATCLHERHTLTARDRENFTATSVGGTTVYDLTVGAGS